MLRLLVFLVGAILATDFVTGMFLLTPPQNSPPPNATEICAGVCGDALELGIEINLFQKILCDICKTEANSNSLESTASSGNSNSMGSDGTFGSSIAYASPGSSEEMRYLDSHTTSKQHSMRGKRDISFSNSPGSATAGNSTANSNSLKSTASSGNSNSMGSDGTSGSSIGNASPAPSEKRTTEQIRYLDSHTTSKERPMRGKRDTTFSNSPGSASTGNSTANSNSFESTASSGNSNSMGSDGTSGSSITNASPASSENRKTEQIRYLYSHTTSKERPMRGKRDTTFSNSPGTASAVNPIANSNCLESTASSGNSNSMGSDGTFGSSIAKASPGSSEEIRYLDSHTTSKEHSMRGKRDTSFSNSPGSATAGNSTANSNSFESTASSGNSNSMGSGGTSGSSIAKASPTSSETPASSETPTSSETPASSEYPTSTPYNPSTTASFARFEDSSSMPTTA